VITWHRTSAHRPRKGYFSTSAVGTGKKFSRRKLGRIEKIDRGTYEDEFSCHYDFRYSVIVAFGFTSPVLFFQFLQVSKQMISL
jgi:hypothetical protein